MSKYEDLVNTLEAGESFIKEIETNFNKTFCDGFAEFLGCQPELIHSKMDGFPTSSGRVPFDRYDFIVSLDIVLKDTTKKTLSVSLSAFTKPGQKDPDKFYLKFPDQENKLFNWAQDEDIPGNLGTEFYKALHQIFMKKLSERDF